MNEIFRKYFKGDRIIWFVILGLAMVSVLIIYSAAGSTAQVYSTVLHKLFRQSVFLLVGIGVIVLVHHIPYKYFGRSAIILLYFSILLLFLTLLFGEEVNGAKRWLKLPFVNFTIQSSEFAKLALMLYIARALAQYQQSGSSAKQAFGSIIVHVAIVCGLIFTEDLSTAILIGGASMILMFVGRIPIRYLLGTTGVAVLLFAIVILLAPHVSFLKRAETWKARVVNFLEGNEEKDPQKSYQANHSKMAIATGGILGQGPSNSRQRYFLPLPQSDFVYAIIVEEFGLLGGLVVLMAYLILLFRAGVIVRASTRAFPAFLVIGLTLTLVFQAFVNMGVAVGIFPVTGQPLPLVSTGGSSILVACLAFGAILSVSRSNLEEKQKVKEA